MLEKRKDILIIADVRFWAYHHIALFVKNNFKDKYNIYIDFTNWQTRSLFKEKKYTKFINALFFRLISRRFHTKNKFDMTIFMGYYMQKSYKIPINSKINILGIFTEGFPPSNKHKDLWTLDFFKNHFLSDCDGLLCGSENVKNFYEKFFVPCFHANSSKDIHLFRRKNPKMLNKNQKFIIGWTGNPDRSFKHFHDIIIPAVEKAQKLRLGIELKTRFSGPLRTLPDFYLDVDVVLIASEKDVGPSMFNEAGYMNVPSISTFVGHPSVVIQNEINGIIVKENTIEEFVECIVKLYDDRELLFSMSKRIRNDILDYLGPEVQKKRWQEIFNYYID